MMSQVPIEYTSDLSAEVLRRAFARFPTGVVGVCAELDGKVLGLAASSFVAISLVPPLIAFCIRNESATWQELARAPRLGITVLSEAQAQIARSLAGRDIARRFDGVSHGVSANGAVFVDGGVFYFDCTIHDTVRAGDHHIVLLRVDAVGQSGSALHPLVFYGSRFRQIDLRDS